MQPLNLHARIAAPEQGPHVAALEAVKYNVHLCVRTWQKSFMMQNFEIHPNSNFTHLKFRGVLRIIYARTALQFEVLQSYSFF